MKDERQKVRVYTCPGCKKPVRVRRVGDSLTWRVFDAKPEDKDYDHECGYRGAVPL